MKNENKTFMNKAIDTCLSVAGKVKDKVNAFIIMLMITVMQQPVYASDDKGNGSKLFEPVSINAKESVTPNELAGGIIAMIFFATRFIGIAMVAWGLVMFGLAIKNDEPDSKQKALMTAFAGIIIMSLKTIAKSVGIIQG